MPRSAAPTLLVVTPFLAAANNGNWRTAARWARLAAPDWRVIVQAADEPVTGGGARDGAVAMLALHARRSRAAIAAWRAAHPQHALLVALTGTDLYRDVPAGDPAALASLAEADGLIVLQEAARSAVPAPDRAKVAVVYQSARTLAPWPRKSATSLHAILVAHLREEKDPRTAFAAWRRLPRDLPVTLTIVGAAPDPDLGAEAAGLAAADARVRYLGPRPHAWTRQAIKRAHVLLLPSRMEGGANVVVEAVTAGTPVLGSRMAGNVGMLGAAYPGLFAVGDAGALAALLERCCRDRAFLAELDGGCRARAPLFEPARERADLLAAIEAARAAAGRRHALSLQLPPESKRPR